LEASKPFVIRRFGALVERFWARILWLKLPLLGGTSLIVLSSGLLVLCLEQGLSQSEIGGSGRLEWDLDVSGLYLQSSGVDQYDPDATYSMRIELLDYWATDSNWLRHLVPEKGKGFVFFNLTLQSHLAARVTVKQTWELVEDTGGMLYPYRIPIPYENQVLELSRRGNTWFEWSLEDDASHSTLMVYEVDPGKQVDLTVRNGLDGDILVQVPVSGLHLQYPELEEYRDLSHLQGQEVASRTGAFDVGQDRGGDIVLVYVEGDESNQTSVWFSKLVSGGAVGFSSPVCEAGENITSIAFLDDSQGVYWIALATHRCLDFEGVDCLSGGLSLQNMSIWLLTSGDEGLSWTEPHRVMSHAERHEMNEGFRDLSFLEDSCGGLWLAWNYVYRRMSPTMYIRSVDRGLTWSTPSSNPPCESFYESFYLDVQGNLCLVYRTRGADSLVQVESVDCGETWGDAANLLPYYMIYFAEIYREETGCERVEDLPGLWMTWLGNYRVPDQELKHNYIVEYSEDNGETWHTFGFYDKSRRYRIADRGPCQEGSPGQCLSLLWQDDAGAIYYVSLSSSMPEASFFYLIPLMLIPAFLTKHRIQSMQKTEDRRGCTQREKTVL
jgi:hypothetical protein